MSNNQSNISRRPLLTLMLVLLIFVLPFAGAWFMYNRHVLLPNPVNHGKLISSPISFPRLNLQSIEGNEFTASAVHGKWLLLYYTYVGDKNCYKRLYDMRQVRLALGADSDRVDRLLLLPYSVTPTTYNKIIEHDYSGTLTALLAQNSMEPMNNQRKLMKTVALQPGFLYVADPKGNIILSYSDNADPMGLLKDLKRLLRVSQIG